MRVGTFQSALMLGCLAASWQVGAQQTPEVIVEAPHVQSSTESSDRELYSLVSRVSYADLNLATHSGAIELEKRIKHTAQAVCLQLQKLYPNSVDTDPSCAQAATKNAMVQANKAIAAAEKSAK